MPTAIGLISDSGRTVNVHETDIARFWTKVNKEEPQPPSNPEIGNCWVWKGTICHDGYPVFQTSQKGHRRTQWRAHRLSLSMLTGFDWTLLLALHDCDNPLCVRPDHLSYGTVKHNSEDAMERGRTARGERNGAHTKPESRRRGTLNGNCKLNDEIVREIRRSYSAKEFGQVKLGAKFGVSHSLVGQIVRLERWTHVKDEQPRQAIPTEAV